MLGDVATVFRKESLDNLRDRRSLLYALIFTPLLGPALLAVLVYISVDFAVRGADEPLELPVVGAEHAPNLLQFLRQANADILPAPADPEAAVASGEHDVVLIVPPEYGAALREGRPAAVRLVLDQSSKSGAKHVQQAQRLLAAYGRTLAALRLQARGISTKVVHPVVIEEQDVSTARGRSLLLLGMMTYLFILAMLFGGFYLAIDTTAGERERGSLEPLLTLPVRRGALLMGKLAATALFMMLALALALIAFGVSVNFIPLEELGMSTRFGAGAVLKAFLLTLPLVYFGACLLTVVASFTRSFKEAQNYLSLVALVQTLPIVAAGIYAVKASPWLMTVPSLSQHLLITEIMKGTPVPAALAAISIASTLALGLLLNALALALYRRESLLM